MKKKIAGFAVSTLLFVLCSSAEAQQQAKVPRIGFLTNNSPTTFPDADAAFRLGLRELAYIEGKRIMIEWRYAEGKTRTPPGDAKGIDSFRCGCHCDGRPVGNALSQTIEHDHPHCDGDGSGSGCQWICRRLGSAWRQHHRRINPCTGDHRPPAGNLEQRPASPFSPAPLRHIFFARQCAEAKRDRACRSSAWSQGSVNRYISGR